MLDFAPIMHPVALSIMFHIERARQKYQRTAGGNQRDYDVILLILYCLYSIGDAFVLRTYVDIYYW